MHYIDHLNTDIGLLEISASDTAITSIFFVEKANTVNANAVTEQGKTQLLEYFDGKREEFDLPLAASGTDFQHAVWQALTKIEFGKTCSYKDIAVAINNPKGVRAVGLANGKNPMTIVVPCHRVIGSNGSLTGYAGGMERKAWLLKHEGLSLF